MTSHQSSAFTSSTSPIDLAVALVPADEDFRQAACEEYWKKASLEWFEENAEDLIQEFVKSLKVQGGAIIADYYTQKAHYFAHVGYGKKRTLIREDALAAHLFTLDNPGMIVEDAALDPGFCNHPQVIREPYVRFFCCAPLKTISGHIFGTVEVFDHKPRRILVDVEDKILDFADRIMQGLLPPDQAPVTGRSSSPISMYLKSPYEEPDLIPRALVTNRMQQGVLAAAPLAAQPSTRRFSRGSLNSNARQSRIRQSRPTGLREAESILAEVEEEEEYSFNRPHPYKQAHHKPLGLKLKQQPRVMESCQLSILGEDDGEDDTTLRPQARKPQRDLSAAAEVQRTSDTSSASSNSFARSWSSAGFANSKPATHAARRVGSAPVPNDSSCGAARGDQSRHGGELSASQTNKLKLSVSSTATSSSDSELIENKSAAESSNSTGIYSQQKMHSDKHSTSSSSGLHSRKTNGSRPHATEQMTEDKIQNQIKAQKTWEQAVQLTKNMTMQQIADSKGQLCADLTIMEQSSTGYPISPGYESLRRDVAQLGRERVLADPRWDDSTASQRLAQVHLRNMTSAAHGQLRKKQSKDWAPIPADKSTLCMKELEDANGRSITVQDFRSQYPPKPQWTRNNPEDKWTKDYSIEESSTNQDVWTGIQQSRVRLSHAAQEQNTEPLVITEPLLGKIIKDQPKTHKMKVKNEKAAALKEKRLSEELKKTEKESKAYKTAEGLEQTLIEERDVSKALKDAERAAEMAQDREDALKYVRGRKAEIEEDLARNPRPDSRSTDWM